MTVEAMIVLHAQVLLVAVGLQVTILDEAVTPVGESGKVDCAAAVWLW